MDLAEATRQPIPVLIGGIEYLVQPRTRAELGPMQALYKRSVPSPLVRAGEALAQARRMSVPLPAAIEDQILDRANRAMLAWPPDVGSWPWIDECDLRGLVPEVLRFALLPHHPDLTLDAAKSLYEVAGPGELVGLIAACFTGRAIDPKAPAAGTTTTETTTTNAVSPTGPDPAPIAPAIS